MKTIEKHLYADIGVFCFVYQKITNKNSGNEMLVYSNLGGRGKGKDTVTRGLKDIKQAKYEEDW